MNNEAKNLSLAPHTNRGVVSTSKLPTILLFDWVQVTIFPFTNLKDKNTVQRVRDYYDLFWYLFKIDRTKVLFNVEKPVLCYDFVYSYKNIKILGSDSHPEFGVHILLSGSACREFEDMDLKYDEFFYKLREFSPHYTRLDVSYDNFDGKYWTLNRIAKCIANVEVVTRFRSSISIKKEDLISLDNIGYTIQFGSRSSDIQFTFYDKLKERKANNYELNFLYSDLKYWFRFETRFRNDKALSVVNSYLYFSEKYKVDIKNFSCTSFNEYMKSIINNYISFRIRSETDKKRCRWKVQPWWKKFLSNCSKIKFQNKPIEYSIVKKRNWIDRSVSFSNFCVMLSEIEDLTSDSVSSHYLYQLFLKGSEKITNKELQYINEYRVRNNLSLISIDDIKDYVDSVKEILVKK